MSKGKILVLMILAAFVMSITLITGAVAGEKIKARAVWYRVKAESVNVPGEEGRIILLLEDKGMLTILEGNKLMDKMVGINVGSVDINTKTGEGFGHGTLHFTDRDGDKVVWAWEGKAAKGRPFTGQQTVVKATGKFGGLKVKEATFYSVVVAPNQTYVDWEVQFE